MIKICHFITELDIGGVEKHLFELVKRIDKSRFLPVVGALSGRGKVGKWIEAAGVKVFYVEMEKPWDLLSILRLKRILKREKVDILHTFLFHANVIGRLAGRLAGVKKTVSSTRIAERRPNLHCELLRLTRGLVDHELAVSEDVRHFMIERAGISPEKITVIPNGLDFELYRGADRAASRRKLDIPPEAFVICFVGRLDEQKRPDVLLKAWAGIRDKVPAGRVIIVGDKPSKDPVVNLARKLGVEASVDFPGWREDALDFIVASDIFVLPSMGEGMSNVAMQALAVGTPVITTKVEGMNELLCGGDCGVMVRRDSPGELAAAIVDLYENPEKREKLAAAGRGHVEKNYRIEDVVKKYEDKYIEILAG